MDLSTMRIYVLVCLVLAAVMSARAQTNIHQELHDGAVTSTTAEGYQNRASQHQEYEPLEVGEAGQAYKGPTQNVDSQGQINEASQSVEGAGQSAEGQNLQIHGEVVESHGQSVDTSTNSTQNPSSHNPVLEYEPREIELLETAINSPSSQNASDVVGVGAGIPEAKLMGEVFRKFREFAQAYNYDINNVNRALSAQSRFKRQQSRLLADAAAPPQQRMNYQLAVGQHPGGEQTNRATRTHQRNVHQNHFVRKSTPNYQGPATGHISPNYQGPATTGHIAGYRSTPAVLIRHNPGYQMVRMMPSGQQFRFQNTMTRVPPPNIHSHSLQTMPRIHGQMTGSRHGPGSHMPQGIYTQIRAGPVIGHQARPTLLTGQVITNNLRDTPSGGQASPEYPADISPKKTSTEPFEKVGYPDNQTFVLSAANAIVVMNDPVNGTTKAEAPAYVPHNSQGPETEPNSIKGPVYRAHSQGPPPDLQSGQVPGIGSLIEMKRQQLNKSNGSTTEYIPESGTADQQIELIGSSTLNYILTQPDNQSSNGFRDGALSSQSSPERTTVHNAVHNSKSDNYLVAGTPYNVLTQSNVYSVLTPSNINTVLTSSSVNETSPARTTVHNAVHNSKSENYLVEGTPYNVLKQSNVNNALTPSNVNTIHDTVFGGGALSSQTSNRVSETGPQITRVQNAVHNHNSENYLVAGTAYNVLKQSNVNTVVTQSSVNTVPTTSSVITVPATMSVNTAPATSTVNAIPATTSVNTVPATSTVNTMPATSSVNTVPATSNVNTVPATSSVNTVLKQSSANTVLTPSSVNTVPATSNVNTVPATSSVNTVLKQSSANTVLTPSSVNTVLTPRSAKTVVTSYNVNTDVKQNNVKTVVTPYNVNTDVTPNNVKTVVTPNNVKTVERPSNVNGTVPEETSVQSTVHNTNSENYLVTETTYNVVTPSSVDAFQEKVPPVNAEEINTHSSSGLDMPITQPPETNVIDNVHKTIDPGTDIPPPVGKISQSSEKGETTQQHKSLHHEQQPNNHHTTGNGNSVVTSSHHPASGQASGASNTAMSISKAMLIKDLETTLANTLQRLATNHGSRTTVHSQISAIPDRSTMQISNSGGFDYHNNNVGINMGQPNVSNIKMSNNNYARNVNLLSDLEDILRMSGKVTQNSPLITNDYSAKARLMKELETTLGDTLTLLTSSNNPTQVT